MAAQMFYHEDTVSVRGRPYMIGVVERTHDNPDTHELDPMSMYPSGLIPGPSVSDEVFAAFIHKGIPARGTVLVSWAQLPWTKESESRVTLMNEADLILEDRAVLEGDIVKKSARSTVSGTVVRASSTATLLQSLKWPRGQSGHADNQYFRGNFPSAPVCLLKDIPSDELKWSKTYQEGDFILYKDWVGRVTHVEEVPFVRLADNSVVRPEDPEEGALSDFRVGDHLLTTKGALRRGRWIYGSYNADIKPEGYVADVRQLSVVVDWLDPRPSFDAPSSIMPPEDLAFLDLEDITLYDRTRRPQDPNARRLNFELTTGDLVRFRDIAGAAVKYDGSTSQGKLTRILRTESLGYDINVFLVVCTRTTVDVEWQDGTKSEGLDSRSLYIPLDLDLEDLLPGDMVCPKVPQSTNQDAILTFRRIGIAQTIRSKDQVGVVKWMTDAEIQVTFDVAATLLPGSRTSALSEQSEEVSMYDIVGLPGLSRRVGDFVAIIPSSEASGSGERHHDTRCVLESTGLEWFGEVIALGLDGLLTVRLGAAQSVRDIKVPWENTMIVWSSDDDEDPAEHDEFSDDEISEQSEDSYTFNAANLARSVFGPRLSAVIPGLNGRPAPDDDDAKSDASWYTDDDPLSDHDDVDEQGDVVMSGTEQANGHPQVAASPALDTTNSAAEDNHGPTAFTYSSIANIKVAPFEILDTALPSDHKYAQSPHDLAGGKQLQRVMKEHKILRQSMPAGAFIRTWESSMDCMRILLLGPLGTPYEYAPFVFDLYLDSNFPREPPQVYFHSWTNGHGPCNPNLYEDGKVCLSLLGTWPGDDKSDTWSDKCTILQIVVSLLGLVLNSAPYYNEAGYEVRVGSVESEEPARLYSERAYLRTRAFIKQVLTTDIGGLEQTHKFLYTDADGPRLLKRSIDSATEVIRRSKQQKAPVTNQRTGEAERSVSIGATRPLRQQIEELIKFFPESEAQTYRDALEKASTTLAT